ncbi:MAG: SufD family Fe-S cluster assembly protein [Candidatus Omnitrophica bacterium]|nr:SufD family Fe-S cluster assembly protein [Candidatus Omnitrophota bacterium]MBU1871248.1 SufD family Fe-S cluster assembly protein [Candidatus Omnitrophota bacterium]
MQDKTQDRAEESKDKIAAFGPDIDISKFQNPEERESIKSLLDLPEELMRAAEGVGVELKEEARAGTFFQLDHSVIYQKIRDSYQGQVEIMSITEALEKYPEIRKKYYWKAVSVDKDKYTAYAELHPMHGYFIRVLKGNKVGHPIQSCLLLQENATLQNVHNIIIVEEGAEAQIITGCSIAPKVKAGLHIGISEFYLEKNSNLTFTMIHNWAEEFHVRPRSAAILEDGAVFTSNYILPKAARSIQMFPSALLKGRDSVANFNSLLWGLGDSYIDVGSNIILEGDGSRGQARMRSICYDRAQIYARGILEARHNNTRAHLDCRGILFSEQGRSLAIPELIANKAPGSTLSHEAAIGPINEEEIHYLMSRGLSREAAIAMIVKGFEDVSILGLPAELESYISHIMEMTQKEAL